MSIFSKIKALAVVIVLMAESLSPSSSSSSSSPIAEISVDGQKIYTSFLKLRSGEIAYFGFEPIYNTERSKGWRDYCNSTTHHTRPTRGCFPLACHSAELFQQITKTFFTDVSLADEFSTLVKNIPDSKKQAMENALGQCGNVSFMHTGIGDYIVYISKKTILGLYPFPKDEIPDQRLDQYIKAYDHIVMSVSAFGDRLCINKTDKYYEHRGISRNPMSMLRKDYQGVGLLLHAFAGAVSQKRGYTYMTVNPDLNIYMTDLLLNAFDESEMSPGHFLPRAEKAALKGDEHAKRILAKFPNKDKNVHADQCSHTFIVITTEALKRKFVGAYQQRSQ